MIVSQNDKYIVAFELFTKDGKLLTEEIINNSKSEEQTAITKDDIEFISMDCYFEVRGFPTCSIYCKCKDTRIIANCALLSFSISTFVNKSTEDRDKLAVNFPAVIYNTHWTSQWDCRIDCYIESFSSAFKRTSFCFPIAGELKIPDKKEVIVKRIGLNGKVEEVKISVVPFESNENGVVGSANDLSTISVASRFISDDKYFNGYTLTTIGSILKYLSNFTFHKISDKVINELSQNVKRNYENSTMMGIWDHLVQNSDKQLYMNFNYIRILGFDEEDNEIENNEKRIIPIIEPNGTIDANRTFENINPSANGVEYKVDAGKFGTIIKNNNGGVFNVFTSEKVLQKSNFAAKLFQKNIDGNKFVFPQSFIFMTKSPNFLTIGDKALVFNSKEGCLIPGYVIRERLTFTNIITGVYEIGCFGNDDNLLKISEIKDNKNTEQTANK